ncbi:TetR family transcriptional regulator [Hoyosella rhizosphaerae]|uniref:Transcriptional regulator, TetR family protein n=1 Tax=Hoyosella rhizosphaerae TaxID=1755582 RepID=A0A916U0V1_9ACTN|nr:helix-turn-helix domain-containing protein [Hoyosella rhizosphaerae]MBN4926830.1 TetR family transcriptional regulator [Hoyosella rhizosphaerae]GGC56173.1 putative transcriptional regulator, TetR family protein [Hoyosella rhizosphaerae]
MANSLDDVIDAALRVLDKRGMEFFSMRRIAAELDVQPSALYHHVDNKQTLLTLMASRIVAPVVIDEDLTTVSHRLRAAMLGIRDGAEVVATATAFKLGSSTLEAEIARFSTPDIARTLLIYIIGHTQATQLHTQASALGLISQDSDLDASFERGLRIILGTTGANPNK